MVAEWVVEMVYAGLMSIFIDGVMIPRKGMDRLGMCGV